MSVEIFQRLKRFIDDEAKSRSMDYGCETPLYVYRMLGGQYPIEDIESGLIELRKTEFVIYDNEEIF